MYDLTKLDRPLFPIDCNESAKHKTAVDEVVECYRSYHKRSRAGKATRLKIVERFTEGYTVQDLCDAIVGCHVSPFHQGQNDRQRKYLSLELIMRNSETVSQFLDIFDDLAKQHWRQAQERDERSAASEKFRKPHAQRQAKRNAANQ